MKVSAIFDIGKTNKKFFLFDPDYQEVFKEFARFDQTVDDDGYESEDLEVLEDWMMDVFHQALGQAKFDIETLNFTSYGASFVHIGSDGNVVAPLYNYLKPIPEDFIESFYDKYGGQLNVGRQTASPSLGLLNSGLQLYWLKYKKPDIFSQIKWSLHLPQYLSYLFTGKVVSEYTSIGCHTLLWDFNKKDYHQWVYQEGIDRMLPPIVGTNDTVSKKFGGKEVSIGVGIHDSSSALLPYIKAEHKPFLLVSTGTWSICLNGFSKDPLTEEDLLNDCLNFIRPNGSTVKACRLFLGREYRSQVQHLNEHYGKEESYHRRVKFDAKVYSSLIEYHQHFFRFEHIQTDREQPGETSLELLSSYEMALHKLLQELVELQINCIKRAIGTTEIHKIYIDGGFANNDLFVQMLADNFPGYKIRITKSPLGSALGAAIVASKPDLNRRFLKKEYAMKKIKSKA